MIVKRNKFLKEDISWSDLQHHQKLYQAWLDAGLTEDDFNNYHQGRDGGKNFSRWRQIREYIKEVNSKRASADTTKDDGNDSGEEIVTVAKSLSNEDIKQLRFLLFYGKTYFSAFELNNVEHIKYAANILGLIGKGSSRDSEEDGGVKVKANYAEIAAKITKFKNDAKNLSNEKFKKTWNDLNKLVVNLDKENERNKLTSELHTIWNSRNKSS